MKASMVAVRGCRNAYDKKNYVKMHYKSSMKNWSGAEYPVFIHFDFIFLSYWFFKIKKVFLIKGIFMNAI